MAKTKLTFSEATLDRNAIQVDDDFNAREGTGGEEELNALANSIADVGIQTRVGVVDNGDGTYNLVFGFRRMAAAEQAGLEEIPAQVYAKGTSKKQLYLLNMLENVSRQDLNPMEEAKGAKRLLDSKMTEEQVQAQLGWTKTRLTQRLRLLEYAEPVQDAVRENRITVQQANLIAQLPEEQHEKLIDVAATMSTKKLRQMVDKMLASQEAAENPELDDPDGDTGDADADGEEEDAVDPAIVAGSFISSFSDLVVSALTSDTDKATAVVAIRAVDWVALGIDDLSSLEAVTAKACEDAGIIGVSEAVEIDDDDDDEVDGDEPEDD